MEKIIVPCSTKMSVGWGFFNAVEHGGRIAQTYRIFSQDSYISTGTIGTLEHCCQINDLTHFALEHLLEHWEQSIRINHLAHFGTFGTIQLP